MEQNEQQATKYVWANAWGGATSSPNPPAIHAKVKELRRAVGSLAARKTSNGPSFAVKSSKELFEKLQPALDSLDLVLNVVDMKVDSIPPNQVPPTDRGKVVRSACTVRSTLQLVASDGSFVTWRGAGGGMDGDDKAVGKATTYAYKDAVTKGLTLPEKDMLDTDNEQDPGAEPARPAPQQATNDSAPSKPSLSLVTGNEPMSATDEQAEALVAAEIVLASSNKELKAIAMKARKLPYEAQLRLGEIFVSKQKELVGK